MRDAAMNGTTRRLISLKPGVCRKSLGHKWAQQAWSRTDNLRKWLKMLLKQEEEAGQVVPPPHVPFRGCPASLTEGGWPVVCWPTYIIPAARKKFR